MYIPGAGTVDVYLRRLREKGPMLVDALVAITQFGNRLQDDQRP